MATTAKLFYVYQYLRQRDSKNGTAGSPYYIGKGNGKRIKGKHYVSVPKNENSIQILANNLCESDAFQLEMFLIFLHGRVDKKTGILHNYTDGGEGAVGAIRNEATKKKMSFAHQKRSEVTKLRSSISHKGQRAWNKGRKIGSPTKESREKMSLAAINRKASPETKLAMSITRLGREKTQDHKNKIGLSNKGKTPWNKGLKVV